MGYASKDPKPLSKVAIIDDATITQIAAKLPPTTGGKDGKDGKDGTDGDDADVTKSNIESVLTGVISTHSHVQNLINVTLTIGTINN